MARRKDRGFTLIEVLVAIVVVGVLAAIALPHYGNARAQAFDSQVAAVVRAVATGEEAYFASRQQYAEDVSSLDGVTTGGVTVAITSGNTGSIGSSFRVRGSLSAAPHVFTWISDPAPGEPHLIID